MERKRLEFKREEWAKVKENAKGLAVQLGVLAGNYYSREAFSDIWDALTKVYGKAPNELKTLDEFWTPKMKEAVSYYVGNERLQDIIQLSEIQLEGQFSQSMWRKSYRSKSVGYHAVQLIISVASWVYWHFYRVTVEEMLNCEHEWIRGFKYYIALEIRRGNQKVINYLKEAMLGDNQQAILTRTMIRGIILSGDDELVDLLLKLLVAARLQEGLRQSILESADEGRTDVLIKILKVCLDEDLFRYSSATRAFDTWTGLGYGDAKPAVVKKCAAFAYECLTNEKIRNQYLNSENNLEAYMAIWSMGCYEITDTDEYARKLLDDEKKYRKVLGWLFVSRTDADHYQMRMASKYLDERDEELLAWIISNLVSTPKLLTTYSYGRKDWKCEAVENSLFPAKKEDRKELFRNLVEVAKFIGNKNHEYTGNPFAFTSVTLSNERVIRCLISIAGYDMDRGMIEKLHDMVPMMDVDARRAFYVNLMQPETVLIHREYLREALDDRSVHVKELAVARLSACNLLEDDLKALAKSLRSKSSSLRKSVITIFSTQKTEKLVPIIEALLLSGEENQIQAGVELLLSMKKEQPEIVEGQKTNLQKVRENKLSTQTEILLEQLAENTEEMVNSYTEENGFGLFDPKVTKSIAARNMTEKAKGKPQGLLGRVFGKSHISESNVFSLKELKTFYPTQEEYMKLLERMNTVFEKHANYEYEIIIYDDSRRKVLFGDAGHGGIRIPAEYGKFIDTDSLKTIKMEMVPFYKEFLEALDVYTKELPKMLGLVFVAARWQDWGGWYGLEMMDWIKATLDKGISPTYHDVGFKKYKNRYWQMTDIIKLIPQLFDAHECFTMASKFQRSLIQIIGRENLNKNYAQQVNNKNVYMSGNYEKYPMNHRSVGYWRVLMSHCATSIEDFKEWFLEEYSQEYLMLGKNVVSALNMDEYFRAVHEEIVPKDVLCEKLMLSGSADNNIRVLTAPNKFRLHGKKIYDQYPWAKDYVNRIVIRMVEVEGKRGELPTSITRVAHKIERFEGAEHFCKLLAALGKENFFRGYEYSSDMTKKAVLSRLLKRCYPAKDDTPERLEELLKQTDIKEKRLAEAVMYAPQWAGFAEEILGWPGLKCAVWFFHAHINETFSAEKETEVAIYSPISPQQFNDGAFDKEWFFKAYETLGEKRFQILYKSAKYITTGSNQHRRSQLYSDAVLGKLNAEELKAEIIEKRNQEKLRCYPLIPIEESKSDEALRRYEFIQKFLKESKQFGAQRRESEKKAVNTALENLSITMGFMDVNRMTWYLESEKIDEIRPFMEPQTVEGVELWIEINEHGDAELVISKNGKRQKTLPKTLAKNETVLVLKTMVKDLKEQKRRAKESLERSMVDRVSFRSEELVKISGNPVLAPMLLFLVWTADGKNGFLKKAEDELVLCDKDGCMYTLADNVRVAHPHDLMLTHEWASYMQLLYENKLVQPFKQVFREYYPITVEERQEKTISRRYAGHQVQPKQTVALLKSKGWTVDYEEGLQKVFYNENLIVRMYALADWFSPADVEAPTLEIVQFYDRNTGKTVDLESVPPILFSETMRDLDLVVSIAHVGGVDPEASHSTVEMRIAIAKELLRLMKVTNVEFVGSHAKVSGTLGKYSVHMGSGVVHVEAKGAVAIIPVHSQARGRIFLPFVDEDPKTQEIISKILLLAEDKRIKDPEILRQIM